jgi:hypothetical protein
MIVPGGGIANDGSRWISCKPNFLLPVRVLSKLFRRLMLTKLEAAHAAGQLQFFGVHSITAALSTPITRSGVRNHKVLTRRRRLPARPATIKSP